MMSQLDLLPVQVKKEPTEVTTEYLSSGRQKL